MLKVMNQFILSYLIFGFFLLYLIGIAVCVVASKQDCQNLEKIFYKNRKLELVMMNVSSACGLVVGVHSRISKDGDDLEFAGGY